MIPLIAVVRVRRARGRFTVWAPLFLLWLALAPLALLAAPVLLVVWLVRPRAAAGVALGAAGVLCALAGSLVEVDAPGASVFIRLI